MVTHVAIQHSKKHPKPVTNLLFFTFETSLCRKDFREACIEHPSLAIFSSQLTCGDMLDGKKEQNSCPNHHTTLAPTSHIEMGKEHHSANIFPHPLTDGVLIICNHTSLLLAGNTTLH